MPKNNYLINLQREFKRRIEHTVPLCYACIALALHREYGWGFTRINRLFVASQDIWSLIGVNGDWDKDIDMVQMCLDETGIECRSAVEQERAEREKNKRANKKKSYRKGT